MLNSKSIWRGQPYISWKDPNNMTTYGVPSWSAPLTTDEINSMPGPISAWGKAKPIRHWRKQLIPRGDRGYSRSSVGMPMDTPGGNPTTITGNMLCLKDYVRRGPIITNCEQCDPVKNIIRSGQTKPIPDYNSSTNKYLYSTYKTIEQNETAISRGISKPQGMMGKPRGNIIFKPTGSISSDSFIKKVIYDKNNTYAKNANFAAAENFGYADCTMPHQKMIDPKRNNCIHHHRKGKKKKHDNCIPGIY